MPERTRPAFTGHRSSSASRESAQDEAMIQGFIGTSNITESNAAQIERNTSTMFESDKSDPVEGNENSGDMTSYDGSDAVECLTDAGTNAPESSAQSSSSSSPPVEHPAPDCPSKTRSGTTYSSTDSATANRQ